MKKLHHFMIQFLSEVSDSEQTKRAALDRPELLWMWFFIIVPIRGRFVGRYMGIVFFLTCPKIVKREGNAKKSAFSPGELLFLGMLTQTFLWEALKKDDMECGKFYRGFSYVLPICFILEQPHSGQMWMLKFHTAFSSSAIDRSV